ncbi:unnamed protein product [Mesocestoides corti]|uniref:t-SNARE coiled-coil homology domain-containing protein n=1 Tax=Mesocestoides corti TaxID=53468 RepID=A0A0R3UIF4_MESCO|nr:unnamed protein product [Mesocestoides corti]
MSGFFNLVENLRSEVDKIAALVAEIKQRHSEILAAPNKDDKTKARVEDIMSEIKRRAGGVRSSLKQLELSIQQEEKAGGDMAELRIKRSQHQTIGRRFVSVMQEYNKAQTDYRDANKTRILRQMAIADRHITNEELEDMLESGNPQIFTQSIMADTQAARQTLSEIEARHRDIIKLEQSIKELHDMFQDLATLVDSQQETIDKIEYNVDQAKDYIETAKTDVEKAVVYKKKSRKVSFSVFPIV